MFNLNFKFLILSFQLYQILLAPVADGQNRDEKLLILLEFVSQSSWDFALQPSLFKFRISHYFPALAKGASRYDVRIGRGRG